MSASLAGPGSRPLDRAADGVSTVPTSIPSAELACRDCGESYGNEAWIEAVVPHSVWNQHISPDNNEGGILCIMCMGRRAVAAGLSDVPVTLVCGPFVAVPDANDHDINRLCDELLTAARRPQLNKQGRSAVRRAVTLLHFAASAIEARRVETERLDAEHESAVAESETPKGHPSNPTKGSTHD